MSNNDERYFILEQYRIYSDAKEKFTERHFSTNRFFLVLNVILFIAVFLISTLIPQYAPVIVLSIIGFVVSVMWWVNIDTYQLMIKVKYSKVLEYLESKLPEQPYRKEYEELGELRKKRNTLIFSDLQKHLTLVVALIYVFFFVKSICDFIKLNLLPM